MNKVCFREGGTKAFAKTSRREYGRSDKESEETVLFCKKLAFGQ